MQSFFSNVTAMASGLCVCNNERVYQEDENMEKKNEMKPLDDEMLDMVSGGWAIAPKSERCPYCGAPYEMRTTE